MVKEFAGKKGVCGFMITSVRFRPVHHNSYMKVYSAIEETGLPLAFHAGYVRPLSHAGHVRIHR